jgi:hypothetical protein
MAASGLARRDDGVVDERPTTTPKRRSAVSKADGKVLHAACCEAADDAQAAQLGGVEG